MYGAPRGIRTPNRQIRSLVTLGPCLNHLAGQSDTEVPTRVTLESTVLMCPGSGAATRVVGVRPLAVPELTLVTKSGAACTSRTGSLHKLGTRTPGDPTRPHRLDQRATRSPICQPRQPIPLVRRQRATLPAGLYPPTASLRLGGQQPHDDPSHLGKHSTPGCEIEVWSHPRPRRGRPTPAGHRTTGPGAAMAFDFRSWGPPVACPTLLPHGAVGPGRLLHDHTGHAARGPHRPRGRRHPAGRAQPALPGGRPRRDPCGPHRPQYPHPQASPVGPPQRRQPPASHR